MFLSDKHKFIFIHIYKVAGTSIRAALNSYSHLVFHHHIKAREARIEVPKKFREYFKFAFVRNPWDWEVSLYHYAIQTPKHKFYHIIKDMSFKEFIKWKSTRRSPKPEDQRDFVTDEHGKVIVDMIGRFENLQADFAEVTRRLSLGSVTIPHTNQSGHKPYWEVYDEETRRIVEAMHKADIEMFRYKFKP